MTRERRVVILSDKSFHTLSGPAGAVQENFAMEALFADGLVFNKGIAASSFSSKPTHQETSVIALGFGLPDPGLFRMEAVQKAAEKALQTDGKRALQYGGGDGTRRLPAWIAHRQQVYRQIVATPEQILVTHGSSQAMDLIARVFLNPGDDMWFERPTYFGAIKIFGLRGVHMHDFPMDEQGLDVNAVVRELSRRESLGISPPKLFYVIPNYQNPSGRSLSVERRKQLVAAAERYGIILVEDDAYGDLGFEGPALPTLRELSPSHVIYMNTFSKTIAPGFRIGWIVGPEKAVAKMREVKAEGANGGFVQEVMASLLESMDYEAHVEQIRHHYRQRRDAMLEALSRELAGSCQWTRPAGGFFVWLSLPEGMPSSALKPLCQELGVSFVDGSAFYVGTGGRSQMRLSFSLYGPEDIAEGIRRLADAIRRSPF